ncbi:Type-2 serine--tRNA ligase [Candidatus Bilamarchaeum dharawalense]|uniref:Type-2 serine--tRNA ligase n=1 Tax=Candidatus Bilamarchaeum dharawalense TaxID=2885759 RepID=A0A5E4LRZ9_9ARCH|nr:Type-2 serine--tRNA ligase [Candidatus Bilamarchaeum dharawalense]
MTIITTKTKPIPRIEGEIIRRSPSLRTARKIRGFDSLVENNMVGEFLKNSGQFVILPKGARLMKAICTLLDRCIRKPLGFEEVFLPKIAPVDSFRKAGILGKWDGYLIAAIPFSDTHGVTEEYLLDPLQCTTFYQFHENKVIDTSMGPVKWFDSSGPTYRNEDSDRIVPLVKQREFHRAEFVYMGTRAHVIQIREECLARLERMCRDLGLGYRIVVGSGCYQLESGKSEMPQTVEEIPIKDLEIHCPGYENGGSFLEVAGSAVLGTIITSRFKIRDQNGNELWSGCTGIGLERLMFAVLTNYGVDFDNLPVTVQEAMA